MDSGHFVKRLLELEREMRILANMRRILGGDWPTARNIILTHLACSIDRPGTPDAMRLTSAHRAGGWARG